MTTARELLLPVMLPTSIVETVKTMRTSQSIAENRDQTAERLDQLSNELGEFQIIRTGTESFQSEMLFVTLDDEVIGEINAGWDGGVSGLSILAIARSGEIGYLPLVAYNDDRTKQNNIQILSTGVTHMQPYQGSDVGDNTQYVDIDASSNQTAIVQSPLRIGQRSSGTPAAGFGIGMAYFLHNAANTAKEAGGLRFKWTRATDASENSVPKLVLMRNGNVDEVDPFYGSIGAAVSISLTTSPQAIISKTIRGYSMGTTGMVETAIKVVYHNNSGANRTLTFTYSFGGYSFSYTTPNLGNAATQRHVFELVITTTNNQATNAQTHHILLITAASGTNGNAAALVDKLPYHAWDTSAVDTTADITGSITVLSSAATATQTLTGNGAMLGPAQGA